MSETNKSLPPTASFGQRLRHYRDRSGKTRTVVGGLMGRSAEWVKALEADRIVQPRLPMLIRLADILNADLADLTGEARLSRAAYTKHADRQLQEIRSALVSYPIATPGEPVTAEALTDRAKLARLVDVEPCTDSGDSTAGDLADDMIRLLAEGLGYKEGSGE